MVQAQSVVTFNNARRHQPSTFDNNNVDVTPDAELEIAYSTDSRLTLFSLPPEILCEIFVAIVLSRVNTQPWRKNRKLVESAEKSRTYISSPDIKRALRLRLVNRTFREYTNEAIFRSGVLDDIIHGHHLTPFISDRPQQWASFLQTYVATLVFRERFPKTPRGQFRHAGEQLHLLNGGLPDDEDGLFQILHGLCGLVVDTGAHPGLRELVGKPSAWSDELRYDNLILEGAAFMGMTNVVEKLLKEGTPTAATAVKANWDSTTADTTNIWEVMTPRGNTLERLAQVASLRGNLDMLRLVLRLCPEITNGQKFPRDLASVMVGSAAMGGHAHVFHYALDHGEPLSRDPGDACHLYWAVLEQAMLLATEPNVYRRSAAALAPPELQEQRPLWGSLMHGTPLMNSPSTFPRSALTSPDPNELPPTPANPPSLAERYGDLLSRVTTSARWGRDQMVKFVLDDEKGRQLGVLNNPDARREDYHSEDDDLNEVPFKLVPRPTLRPLLSAVEGGDVEIVKMMLARGAEPNWFAPEDTALMAAVHKDNIAMATALLDAGADVNDGLPPPIAIAVRHENEAMFRLLRSRGARLDTARTGGWAMAFATGLGLDSMVELLLKEEPGLLTAEEGPLALVDGLEAKSEYNFKAGDYGPVMASYW